VSIRSLLKFFGLPLIKLGLFLLTLVELPIFILRNPAIFKNEIVYVFWIPSFGHTIVGFDFASRLFYPHRISLVYLPNPSSNSYLPKIFPHNIDPFIFRSIAPPLRDRHDAIRFRVFRVGFLLLSGLTEKFQVIEHKNIYKTLSLAMDQIKTGKEEKDILEKEVDFTGYVYLLKNKIGKSPKLPKPYVDDIESAIKRDFPKFFEKPFVTVHLRKKGIGGTLDASFRNPEDPRTYRDGIKYLIKNGYHVVLSGETNREDFSDIENTFDFDALNGNPEILNLYLLMNCGAFIGQQSGPLVLCNTCNIPVLICDAMPYRLGTFKSEDIIVFKTLRKKSTGQKISVATVYKDYPDLAYGYRFSKHGISIESNTSDEILEGVKELVAIEKGTLKLTKEDSKLLEAFRSLPDMGMSIRHQGTHPPLSQLRGMKSDLLHEPTLG